MLFHNEQEYLINKVQDYYLIFICGENSPATAWRWKFDGE
jgi:hypothetical protein